MIRTLLFDPDAFMRRRADDSGLAGPAMVVLLAGVAGVLSGLLVVQQVASNFEGDIGTVLAIGGVFTVIAGLVSMFFFWAVFAGAFHVISLAFDGEGDLKTTLALVGWGFLPSIVSGLVTAAAFYLALQNASVPADPAAMASFQQRLQSRSIFTAASLVAIALTLWQGFIWVFAVKHARQLDGRGAILTVAGPVALSILWTVYNLL